MRIYPSLNCLYDTERVIICGCKKCIDVRRQFPKISRYALTGKNQPNFIINQEQAKNFLINVRVSLG